MLKVLLISFVILINPRPAFPGNLFYQPTGFSIRGLDEARLYLYGDTGGDINWKISQWNSPPNQILRGFREVDAGVFKSHGQNAQVMWSRDDGLTLSSLGFDIPCGKELDLFASPLKSGYKSFIDHGGLSGSSFLVDIKNITLSFELEFTSFEKKNVACDVNQGAAIAALVMTNVLDNSTLFYQIRFTHYRNGEWKSNTSKSWWSLMGGRFNKRWGFDDNSLTDSDMEGIMPGERTEFEIEIYDKVVSAINDELGPPRKDLGEWIITGFYLGNHVWGGVGITTRWADINVYLE